MNKLIMIEILRKSAKKLKLLSQIEKGYRQHHNFRLFELIPNPDPEAKSMH